MTHPKYNPSAKCPKCGHDVVSARYCIGKYPCVHFPFEEFEHMDRTCQHCGYEWVEACLDETPKE